MAILRIISKVWKFLAVALFLKLKIVPGLVIQIVGGGGIRMGWDCSGGGGS